MRYFCIVSYDGYSYFGYQIQRHEKNTIQETIQDAIKKVFNEDILIYASGRTDCKVHAYGQTFHFDSDKKIPCSNVKKALNCVLPESIFIKSVKIVNDTFHSRFSTHKKVYEYKIINSDNIDVFKSRYYAYIKDKIDLNKLNEASKSFIGIHDFYNFTTNKKGEVKSFEKQIYDVTVKSSKNNITITFTGSGFLRYQVRMMVGALIAVSTGKENIEYIEKKLNDEKQSRCSYKASPQGLYLKKVIY